MNDYNKYKGVPFYLKDIMRKRYCQEGEDPLNPSQIFRRVADYVASAEKSEADKYAEIFYKSMMDGLWVPSSPFLMNAGTKVPMLSACFVCDLQDDLSSIYDTLKVTAIIQKMGGGTGFDFSALRAEGAAIKSTGGTSSGPLSFMEIFNASGGTIKQGGRRRSANMGVLNVHHPDILKFIKYKSDRNKLNMFNVSVAITDEFMQAVLNNEKYDLIEPSTGEVVGQLDANEVLDLIAYYSWENAEPGVMFIDTINKYNPTPHLGRIRATNPCGEIPLLPWEACNLASINLERFVDEKGNFDYDKLRKIVHIVVRFLDDAIDVNHLPTKQIEKAVYKTRKLGLGIMGLHGAMMRMGIIYNSKEGLEFAESIMKFINEEGHKYSSKLAEERGCYPAWEGSIHEKQGIKMRNATITTIAPTGTISMIANASSSGLEPAFALVYERRIDDKMHYIIVPAFEEIAKKEGFWTDDLPQKVVENYGRATGIDQIPEKWQKIFVTAMEIDPIDHIKMQAVMQKHVDNSISKTINLPRNASQEYIKDLLIEAWKLGLKGCTLYRDGSREGQVLNLKKNKSDKLVVKELERGDWAPIAEDTIYYKRKIYTGCGKITLFIGWSPSQQKIQEFYIKRSGQGGCERNLEAIAIYMSGMLRLGGNLFNIEKAIEGIGTCSSFASARTKNKKLSKGHNCSTAILFEIKKFLDEQEINLEQQAVQEIATSEEEKSIETESSTECPECGEPLNFENGCIICRACGYSKCD